ncbi:hypothetical protein GLAREA_02405 [Glarea lozoyensis ATCC 20868]|uniref:Uncharacterized protein n=1 Tax=Glarea lozoyensis (strain ATCC 20868 / MF5171) TaxID=1116229 RepID=S3CJ05_GLAL2|nr:uncharacterized protein GLAREA_02405 [Glarea lozoyensis ATCC 20868]EPE26492.1 hypothetical protein GLAREA_02405 [Glarea lozoyensis ATCC 20868]
MVFGVPSSPSMEALRKEVGNSLTWDSSSKVSRSLSKWKQIATHVLVSLLTASICWLYFTNSSTLTNKALAPASKLLHCGNSTAEARALGCEFDPLTVAWIPEPCINHQITKEFIAEYPWEAFSDRTSNELIVKDQMSE